MRLNFYKFCTQKCIIVTSEHPAETAETVTLNVVIMIVLHYFDSYQSF
jgi:hypothetical protein